MTATGERDVELVLVEDNPADAEYVSRLLHESQATIEGEGSDGLLEITSIDHVDRLTDGLERIRVSPPDVVLLDLMLPDSSGLETVESMVDSAPSAAVVVLTGEDDTNIGVEAIQRGAQDYLVKGTITAELLHRTLRYAIERKRNQRELVDRNHRLALLNQIVRQDIRNDASMIVGWGDQLRSGIDPNDEVALEALLEATQHVVDLTDTAAEVMDVISAETGTSLTVRSDSDSGSGFGSASGVHLEPCDLYAILDAEGERLEREHDVEFTLERADTDTDTDADAETDAGSDTEVGPDTSALTVVATPMLSSVFKHLFSNAVRHNDHATPRVAVTVDATATHATVTIADDGVGIPDRQKALLVDPEARFDDRSGMGTGLYLVKTLLEGVDGTLEFEDNHPRGTVVTVTLERVAQR